MDELKLLSIGYVMFFSLIGVEWLWSRQRGDGGYRWGQFVANIGHGVVFQVSDAFTKALVMAPFLWVSSHFALGALPTDAVWSWVVGLLAYDFCSYWRHRHKHEIHVLWAIHGVHHAAEDFNFAAALRQALFQNVVGWLWMLPLALFVPVPMFVGLIVFDYLFQFVQHTRYVPKLGPIEWVFNTPSHHRVHHGTEEKYLDKNYAGILIIWDRMFGTFQEEEEEPTYGLTKPIGSLDPVWGNLALFQELIEASRRTSSWRDTVALWLRGPAAELELAPGAVLKPRDALRDADISMRTWLHAMGTFGMGTACLAAMVWIPEDAVTLRVVFGALAVTGATVTAGLLEQRSWAPMADGVRLAVAALAWSVWAPAGLMSWILAATVGVGVVFGGAARWRHEPVQPVASSVESAGTEVLG